MSSSNPIGVPSTSTSTPKLNLPSTQSQSPSPSPSPSTATFDGLSLSPISQLSLSSLLTLLDTIPESKTLMLDPSLAGPLGLIADVNSLRQHGVEKMFWLEEEKAENESFKEREELMKGEPKPKNVNSPTRAVVYICRPERRWIRVIASELLQSLDLRVKRRKGKR